MHKLIVASFVLFAAMPVPAAQSDPTSEFRALVDADWQWRLRTDPTFASQIGDHRYDDRWEDLSPEAIAAAKTHHAQTLAQLRKIDRKKLPAPAQLDYDLLARELTLDVESDRFPVEDLAVGAQEGVYFRLSRLLQVLTLQTPADYRALLERMHRYPLLIEQSIALMKHGIAHGFTQPQVILREVPKLIDAQIGAPEATPVWRLAFASLPESIDKKTQAELQTRARQLLADEVVPALRKLRAFVVDEYIPHARTTIGATAVPDGAVWYAHEVRQRTTTELSAEQIHQLGLAEVARIRGEMIAVMKKTGWKGDFAGFSDFLRTDKRFFFDDKQQLIIAYRDIAKRIDPELPRLFRTLPRLTYGVVPTPADSERTSTTAYYFGGSPELGRPGRFYANTYDLKSRPKWEMEALTLHEAVPGHHLQIALAAELTNVPEFRRWDDITAFVEGWGLYAESLGPELGLFTDPYAKFGQLTYEMWRAVRLVVDTGMHAKGWTRAQAIQFFRDNTSKTSHDIEVEVDRYLEWPGQALAYKLGELKIKELRAYATKELGDKFSIRDFHDAVLGAGSLPLAVLDERVRGWVVAQKRRATP
jgi:uncharacterized protein (DUF885 family)